MKLVFGQSITPVPWPIHNRPIASASKPTIRSSLRMGVSPWRLAVDRPSLDIPRALKDRSFQATAKPAPPPTDATRPSSGLCADAQQTPLTNKKGSGRCRSLLAVKNAGRGEDQYFATSGPVQLKR